MCHRAVRVAYGLHQSRVAIRGCGNSSGGDGEQASDRGTWRDERVGPGRDGARRLSLIFPVSPSTPRLAPSSPRLTHF
ncbi:unnamed protein product [Euphydryas editha]|uniref:Uncharacterized protein n=1 Tax=Euphydryas editha TaxID=104508 RepID=A0AAU9TT58_EUPED|nr:unnamed protein product [Euphydryas editha]